MMILLQNVEAGVPADSKDRRQALAITITSAPGRRKIESFDDVYAIKHYL